MLGAARLVLLVQPASHPFAPDPFDHSLAGLCKDGTCRWTGMHLARHSEGPHKPDVFLGRGQAYVGAFLKAKDEESSSGASESEADAAPASAEGAQDGVTVEEPESLDEASSTADPTEGSPCSRDGDHAVHEALRANPQSC